MSRNREFVIGLMVVLLVSTGLAFADGVRGDRRPAHSNVVANNQVRTFTASNIHSSAFSRNVPQGNAYAYGHFTHPSHPVTPVLVGGHDLPKTTATVPEGSSLLMLGSTLIVLAGALRRKVLG